MRRYLLDTGMAQDFINSRHGVRERVDEERHQGHRIGICVPVLGELWAGIEGKTVRNVPEHHRRESDATAGTNGKIARYDAARQSASGSTSTGPPSPPSRSGRRDGPRHGVAGVTSIVCVTGTNALEMASASGARWASVLATTFAKTARPSGP